MQTTHAGQNQQLAGSTACQWHAFTMLSQSCIRDFEEEYYSILKIVTCIYSEGPVWTYTSRPGGYTFHDNGQKELRC
jgi:hypothetical protein